jgi:hypothetical protein
MSNLNKIKSNFYRDHIHTIPWHVFISSYGPLVLKIQLAEKEDTCTCNIVLYTNNYNKIWGFYKFYQWLTKINSSVKTTGFVRTFSYKLWMYTAFCLKWSYKVVNYEVFNILFCASRNCFIPAFYNSWSACFQILSWSWA